MQSSAAYGFRNITEVHPDVIKTRILPAADTRFAVTGEFFDEAKNHCGAVCATNVLLYFRALAGVPVKSTTERHRIFTAIHDVVGNGPIFSLQKKISRCPFIAVRGKKLRSVQELVSALDHGCPCILLLANGLFDWHWVLCVGYLTARENGQEKLFLRLADSWTPVCNTIYEPGVGSKILSMTAYRHK